MFAAGKPALKRNIRASEVAHEMLRNPDDIAVVVFNPDAFIAAALVGFREKSGYFNEFFAACVNNALVFTIASSIDTKYSPAIFSCGVDGF